MRIVVKFGTSLLTSTSGELSEECVVQHADALSALLEDGHEVVVVSSGAISAGFVELGLSSRPEGIIPKQACAAVGQRLLLDAYATAFRPHGRKIAQILLTRRDFFHRKACQNAQHTLEHLLEQGVLPIINENDTVATGEISFGDNDRLAALTAGLLHAEHVLLLTSVPGVFRSESQEVIPSIENFEEILQKEVSDTTSSGGTGGMRSKLLSSQLACQLGCSVFIGGGAEAISGNFLRGVLTNDTPGTYCTLPEGEALQRKKQWIAFHASPTGRIWVDRGAEKALCSSSCSLLAVGVTKVSGSFAPEDVVEVISPADTILGRGVVTFPREELETLITQAEIPKATREVIHRDAWVPFEQLEIS